LMFQNERFGTDLNEVRAELRAALNFEP